MRYLLTVLAALCFAACTTPAEPVSQDYQRISFEGEKATAEERALCESVGGTVRRAGMLGWEHCIQDMPDAGQVCSDGSECVSSRCIIPPQEGREYAPGDPATGMCAQTKPTRLLAVSPGSQAGKLNQRFAWIKRDG